MRRKYDCSPTTYSNKKSAPTQFVKTQFSPCIFSNLLCKIEKNTHSQNKNNRTSIFQPHRGSYCKIRPYELHLRESDTKMLDISQFISNRKNKERDQIRYSTQIKSMSSTRSILKKHPFQKIDPENKLFLQESPKLLSGTCKVSPIIISRRPQSSRQRSQNNADSQDNPQKNKIKWTNLKVKSKQPQESGIVNSRKHNEEIEPWAFRNNESIML